MGFTARLDKTGSPPSTPDVVQVGVYHLEQIHIVRSPQENHLLLVGLDLTRNLDLISRYQVTYLNQTLGYLVSEMCTRGGLFSMSIPGTTQMSQVIASFVLQAGQTYRHALDELCTTYGLVYFLDQSEMMQFRGLASSDPSVDDANLHLVGVERLLHHVDPKLTSTTQCAQKANFLLLQEQRVQAIYTLPYHSTLPYNFWMVSPSPIVPLRQAVDAVLSAALPIFWRTLMHNTV